MDAVFTYIFYGITGILLILSYLKDKQKTYLALKRAWSMFCKVLPQFVSILLLVGLLLVIVSPATIRRIIGAESGFVGMVIASLLGSITLVPVFIAFPIAAELITSGAGVMQITVFIQTLTTVGLVTLPMEINHLGRRTAILRNLLAFFFSYMVAWVVGMVLA